MIKEYVKNFIKEEDGAVTIEYVVIIVLIVLVVFAAVGLLGKTLKNKFGKMDNALNS